MHIAIGQQYAHLLYELYQQAFIFFVHFSFIARATLVSRWLIAVSIVFIQNPRKQLVNSTGNFS
jgi:hypothetical protein